MSSKAKIARSLAKGKSTEPLTEADRERAVSKFRNLRGQGGVRIGFAPALSTVFKAGTPEELNEAVRVKLAADSKD